MSNLLKVGTTISKSERIIDYNDIIKDRVEAARAAKRQKADSDGFINGLNADVVERLPEDEINTEAAASEEITQESAEAARRNPCTGQSTSRRNSGTGTGTGRTDS